MSEEIGGHETEGMSPEEFNRYLHERNLVVTIVNQRVCLMDRGDYEEMILPELRRRLIEDAEK